MISTIHGVPNMYSSLVEIPALQ